MDSDSNMELGGKISLSGFNEIKRDELVISKNLIGGYARKFSDNIHEYEGLKLHLKLVHKTPGSEKYEIHGSVLFEGKMVQSEVVERNLFIALDIVLKKLEEQVLR